MTRRFLLVGLAVALPLGATGLLTVLSTDAEEPVEPGLTITTEIADGEDAVTTEAGDGAQALVTE